MAPIEVIDKEKMQLAVLDWPATVDSLERRRCGPPRLEAGGVTEGERESAGDPITRWIGEIRAAWVKGPASALELARLLCEIKDQLPHGGWKALWHSELLPF